MNRLDMENLIQRAVERRVTDIHLPCGHVPWWREQGAMIPCADVAVTEDLVKLWLASYGVSWPAAETLSVAVSWGEGIRLRFHGNRAYRGSELAVRILYPLQDLPPDADQPLWDQLAGLPHGLVLVTGPTGSGKTTTLGRIVQAANERRPCHILTLEDPIEYVLPSQGAFISQREYGTHFGSFADAVKEALRQDPDIILVGEMRDRETMEAALTAAETGHLVLGTLHTRSVAQGVSRFVGAFATGRQREIRQRLSFILQGMIAQELVSHAGGVRVYREILLQSPAVSQLIRNDKDEQLDMVMQTNGGKGMRTMAQARKGDTQHGRTSPAR